MRRRQCRSVGADRTLALELPAEALEAIARRAAEIVQGHERDAAVEPWIGVAEAAEHLHCRLGGSTRSSTRAGCSEAPGHRALRPLAASAAADTIAPWHAGR